MKFARIVYLLAGCYGIIALTPLYFLLNQTGTLAPPAVTHAELYYGFVGVALAFQVVFLVIARDPVKYRALMVPSILEKIAFSVPAAILYAQGRLASKIFASGMIDALWGILFVVAYIRTRTKAAPRMQA